MKVIEVQTRKINQLSQELAEACESIANKHGLVLGAELTANLEISHEYGNTYEVTILIKVAPNDGGQ